MGKTEIPYKQKRRTLWFGFLLILCLLVVIIGNFYYFTQDAIRMSGLSGDRLAMGVIVEEEGVLSSNEELLGIATYGILRMKERTGSVDSVSQWMQEFAAYISENNGEAHNGVYGFVDGYIIDAPDWTPTPEADPDQWSWYKRALLAGGEPAYTDVYEKDGRPVVTIAAAINEGGDVLAIDVDVSELQAVMSDKFSDENGFLCLFDTSGNMLACQHPDGRTGYESFMDDGQRTALFEAAQLNETSGFEYIDSDGRRWLVYDAATANGWVVALTVPYSSIFASVLRMLSGELVVLVIALATMALLWAAQYRERRRAERNRKILEAIGNTYYAIYTVQLQTGRYEIIKSTPEIYSQITTTGSYDDLYKALQNVIAGEHRLLFAEGFSLEQLKQDCLKDVHKVMEFQRSLDGEYQWVSCYLMKMPDFDRSREVMLVFRRIHEEKIKDLEQKKLLSDSLLIAQNYGQAKSDFLSRMSHDMRTPMNAVTGYARLMGEHLGEPDRLKTYLEKLVFSSEQLLSLINEVLDMSKIEQGKLELHPEWLDLAAHMELLLTAFKDQAAHEQKELTYEFHVRHGHIYADTPKLDQILNNLLSNAMKYTRPGDHIFVRVTELREMSRSSAMYRFMVRDTGIGMSEDFLKLDFKPFERERARGAGHIPGTGLGMSIVKNVVQFMNGTMEVVSAPDKGSTFDILLPFEFAEAPERADGRGQADGAGSKEITAGSASTHAPTEDGARTPETTADGVNTHKAAEAAQAPETRDCGLEGCRILIAEDNEINMEIACEIISSWGIFIDKTYDGCEAADKFSQMPENYYDMILMDIQMPKMNGFEASRAIRSMDRADAASVPIIAMTANAFSDDIAQSMSSGMNAHIIKPVDFDRLQKTLLQFRRKDNERIMNGN